MPEPRLAHHELCFGCGQGNLFGLQLALERRPDGSVEGRFFVKQDHQGPPGFAHGGVMAAALDEAMALVLQPADARTSRLEVDLLAGAPVGSFVSVSAQVEEAAERELRVSAVASDEEGQPLARASGTFVRLA